MGKFEISLVIHKQNGTQFKVHYDSDLYLTRVFNRLKFSRSNVKQLEANYSNGKTLVWNRRKQKYKFILGIVLFLICVTIGLKFIGVK